MPTKVLLIDAQGPWLQKDRADVDQVVLPLGLMMLGSHLKSELGERVDIKAYNSFVDLNNNEDQSIEDCIRGEAPDVIGIRGLTRYKEQFNRIARASKAYSSALVVGGGPHVSSDENYGLSDSEIDLAVFGEGEKAFTEVVRNYSNGNSIDDVRGIVYRNNSAIVRTEPQDFILDLDSLPFPDFDLVDLDRYANFLSYGYNKRRQGVIYSSRGCPYRCTFCHNVFGKKFRWRSPENILEEIEQLYDRNIRDFYFVDDIFNLRKQRSLDLFRLLTVSRTLKDIKLYFVNGLRADLIDHEFIDAAVGAGTIWLSYAIETYSPRLQKVIAKKLDIEKTRDVIEYSASKGVIVNYWGLLGIETETIEEAFSTVQFMNDLPPSIIPMLFSMKPYPGTDVYNVLTAKGEVIHDLESEFHKFLDLIRKDPKYLDVLKLWKQSVESSERLEYSTTVLLNNGFTNDDIKSTYRLLYTNFSTEKIEQLIESAKTHPDL